MYERVYFDMDEKPSWFVEHVNPVTRMVSLSESRARHSYVHELTSSRYLPLYMEGQMRHLRSHRRTRSCSMNPSSSSSSSPTCTPRLDFCRQILCSAPKHGSL